MGININVFWSPAEVHYDALVASNTCTEDNDSAKTAKTERRKE
jgi:hypothetical protein